MNILQILDYISFLIIILANCIMAYFYFRNNRWEGQWRNSHRMVNFCMKILLVPVTYSAVRFIYLNFIAGR